MLIFDCCCRFGLLLSLLLLLADILGRGFFFGVDVDVVVDDGDGPQDLLLVSVDGPEEIPRVERALETPLDASDHGLLLERCRLDGVVVAWLSETFGVPGRKRDVITFNSNRYFI